MSGLYSFGKADCTPTLVCKFIVNVSFECASMVDVRCSPKTGYLGGKKAIALDRFLLLKLRKHGLLVLIVAD